MVTKVNKKSKFDFVSHHPFYGVLLWNAAAKMYNLWMPIAFSSLEDAQIESRVRDGVVVHWSWSSMFERFTCDNSGSNDLPF